jgi:hypothetical protein
MILDPIQILHPFLAQRRTARDLILKSADLRGQQLAGLRADGLDLEDADLRQSSLTGAKWKAALCARPGSTAPISAGPSCGCVISIMRA